MEARVEARLRQQLTRWRDDLINLSRTTNRLLYFRHTRAASPEIERPGSAELLERLNGSPPADFWEFHFPPPPEKEAGEGGR